MEFDLLDLPNSVLFEILVELDIDDIINLCSTNSEYKKICDSNEFWYQKLKYDYPNSLLNKPRNTSYKQWYLRLSNQNVVALTPIIYGNDVYMAEIYINIVSTFMYGIYQENIDYIKGDLNDIVIEAIKKKYDMPIYGNIDYDIILYDFIDKPETIDVIIIDEDEYKIISKKVEPKRKLNNYISHRINGGNEYFEPVGVEDIKYIEENNGLFDAPTLDSYIPVLIIFEYQGEEEEIYKYDYEEEEE